MKVLVVNLNKMGLISYFTSKWKISFSKGVSFGRWRIDDSPSITSLQSCLIVRISVNVVMVKKEVIRILICDSSKFVHLSFLFLSYSHCLQNQIFIDKYHSVSLILIIVFNHQYPQNHPLSLTSIVVLKGSAPVFYRMAYISYDPIGETFQTRGPPQQNNPEGTRRPTQSTLLLTIGRGIHGPHRTRTTPWRWWRPRWYLHVDSLRLSDRKGKQWW